MRRPGLWVANGHPGDPTQMLSWRPGAITCFYDYLGVNGVFQYKAAHPEVPIIVRIQHPRNWHQNPELSARRLGQEVASKWNNLKILDPYVYFANEMNLHYENGDPYVGNQHLYTTPEFYKKYANWVRLTAAVIKDRVPEMKLVTPPFAFGHHEDGSPNDEGKPMEGWAGYDFLADTVRDYFDNILTFHAYWGHSSGSVREWLYDPKLSSWYAFRWRRVLKLFQNRYNIKAKMIIDEAGNFGASDPDFTDQVIYYTKNCLNDARVIALTFFLWLDPTHSPGNLPNSWVQRIQNLSAHLGRLRNLPDIPITKGDDDDDISAPDRPIRVLFDDGTVQVMTLEEYLRAVVPAEIPASWDFEAVKAQAVASRSYAQYAIKHPRFSNADICTNPNRCQNYDESKIHPLSDEAIKATQGIVGIYDGQTIEGIFSANCGGHTRNNEDVFQGRPVPYLRGRTCPYGGAKRGHGVGFCQYGARTLAQQGYTFDQIIRYYYQGVTVGPIPEAIKGQIYGHVFDHMGQPLSDFRLILRDQSQQWETTTDTNGQYQFERLNAGTYQLEVPDHGLRQENIILEPGQKLEINLRLPEPRPTIEVEIRRREGGLPLIVGDWGQPDLPMKITFPSGQVYQIMTGTKPEYGSGGFEFYAVQVGTYILEIEEYRFEIPMNGKFTHLTFVKDGASQQTGIVEGLVKDHLDRPVVNREIHLVNDAVDLTDITDEAGTFLFEFLPPGDYLLTVANSQIKQTVTLTGNNKVELTLKLAPPATDEWFVTLEQGRGLPLLVGDIGLAGEPITIINPYGGQIQVISGSKEEWGIGGFEVYTPHPGDYTVRFLDQTFILPLTGQFTYAVFRPGEAPEEKVYLVSYALPRSQAEIILQNQLEINPATEKLFEIIKPGRTG